MAHDPDCWYFKSRTRLHEPQRELEPLHRHHLDSSWMV
jgi:hypothetical protein